MAQDQAIITVNGPGYDGQRFILQEGITSFGRLPSNDVVLIDDLVSRNHARITFFEGRATLQDLGSHNGSYVNGTRIEGAKLLQGGDMCRLGPFQILYRRGPVSHPRPLPAGSLAIPKPRNRGNAADIAPQTSSIQISQIDTARNPVTPSPAIKVLLRTTEALSSAAAVDDYVGGMLELALDQTGAERGAYVERTQSGLELKRVNGLDGPATDAQVVPAVVDWTVSKNYPVKVDNLASDLRFQGPAQALLCVPVALGDEILGAFHLARTQPAFSADALDTLVAIAKLTGLGLQASRTRRTAVRAHLAKDTLARSFHADVAQALAEPSDDIQARQVTVLVMAARGFNDDRLQHKSSLSGLLNTFCSKVVQYDGRWYTAPGPNLYAVFEDEAGPLRAVAIANEVKTLAGSTVAIRAAVARGVILTGIASSDAYRLPVLAGPGIEAAEQLLAQTDIGQVWLTETAARMYVGPTRPIGNGAYTPN
ncbi:MAG: FHA domain-containing protein [Myxococcota bacterium]